MNKKLFLAGALAAAFALSQNTAEAQTISVGPRVGVNFANFTFSDAKKEVLDYARENSESITGLHAGAVINIAINDRFSIQPELLFSQKGHTRLVQFYNETTEISTHINYLKLPFLVKASFGNDNLSFFINAGPYAAVALGGKKETKYPTHSEEEDIPFEYSASNSHYPGGYYNKNGYYNRRDAGVILGAGLGLNAGPGILNIEARYSYGFSSIIVSKGNRNENTPKMSNQALGISVSYLFYINGK